MILATFYFAPHLHFGIGYGFPKVDCYSHRTDKPVWR